MRFGEDLILACQGFHNEKFPYGNKKISHIALLLGNPDTVQTFPHQSEPNRLCNQNTMHEMMKYSI